MGKITLYLQDDLHSDGFFDFLKRQGLYLTIDSYINSPEYKQVVELGAEHLVIKNLSLSIDIEKNSNYHIEIIAKNEQSSDDLLRKEERKT